MSVFPYKLVMYKSVSYHTLSTPVCSCVLGQSVVLPQPTVVQLQASGVLPASQPVIAVTGGTSQLHNHMVNALPPAAGNGSTSSKIPVTKPLLQSTTPAVGLDVSSDCVMVANNQSLEAVFSYLHVGYNGVTRVTLESQEDRAVVGLV